MCAESEDEVAQSLFGDVLLILGAQPHRRPVSGVKLDEPGASRPTGEAMRVDWGTSDDDFDRDQIKLRIIDRIAGRPTIDEAFAKLTGVRG